MTDARQAAGVPGSDARREYRAVLAALGAGAALLFVGYAQTWATAVVAETGMPTVEIVLKGRDLQPAASASAILALAGIAGLVATRRVGRAVTGALLAFEGLLAAGGAVMFGLAAGERTDVLRLVAERVGVTADADVAVTPWWLAVAFGGVVLVAVGVLAAVRGGRWPVMGRRYEQAGERPAADPAAAGPPQGSGTAAAWDALDAGIDPTLDSAGPRGDAPAADQGARPHPGPDTMTPTDAQEDPR